jgi:pimeloyl-ACP methyl ester carboxylesterase
VKVAAVAFESVGIWDASWAAELVAKHVCRIAQWDWGVEAAAQLAGYGCSWGLDLNTVLLWGTSFGGGHALTTAAKLKGHITAVVAQVSCFGLCDC